MRPGLALALASALALGFFFGLAAAPGDGGSRTGPPAAHADGAAAAADGAALRRDATVRAIEAVSPAVANISTERELVTRDPFFGGSFDNLFREFYRDFAPRRRVRQTSLGSGVVIDPDGYVITNAHVVSRASAIQVTIAGGKDPLPASLVNISPENDLALLRIEAEPGRRFASARLARPDDAIVGETVIALGNPFGLGSTATRGVLSAKDRAVDGSSARADFLQTDAAINPGNSGGPLCDLAGEVIGINTAIYAQAHGIGFAIPIARVRTVALDLLDERELAGRYSGLALDPGGGGEAEADRGARVLGVAPGSPAAAAGIAAGDTIVSVAGEKVAWAFTVKKRFLHAPGGVPLPLVVRSGDGVREVALALGPPPQTPGEKLARERLGLRVKPVTSLLAERLGLAEPVGILVVRVEEDGPAARAGLEPGDVIVRLGIPRPGRRGFIEVYDLRGLDDLAAILERGRAGEPLLIFVLREGRELRGEVELR